MKIKKGKIQRGNKTESGKKLRELIKFRYKCKKKWEKLQKVEKIDCEWN